MQSPTFDLPQRSRIQTTSRAIFATLPAETHKKLCCSSGTARRAMSVENSLPADVRHSHKNSAFKRRLKTAVHCALPSGPLHLKTSQSYTNDCVIIWPQTVVRIVAVNVCVCVCVCVSVCLSVCSHIAKTTRPNVTKFYVRVTRGNASVLF